MNVVFSNCMERKDAEDRVTVAQVSILEEHGTYQTVWQEDRQDETGLEIWYEGNSWEEMMAVFRYRITGKMVEEFYPMIESMPGFEARRNAYANKNQKLQFFSESNRNEQLFQQLAMWRRSKAAEEKVPPYMVANNRLLTLISALIPHTGEELRQIPGFGEQKLAKYAEEVLKITGDYAQATGFPLDWIKDSVDEKAFQNWAYRQKEQKYKAEAEGLALKKKMLQEAQRGMSIDELCGALSCSKREVAILAEQLEAEGYDLGPLIERERKEIPAAEREKVLQAFTEQGDRFLKPVLERVYSPEQLKEADLEELYVRLRMMRLHFRGISGREVLRTG